jgi:hypothetical protein
VPAPATGVLRRAGSGRFQPCPPCGPSLPLPRGILYLEGTVVRAKTTAVLIADAEVADKLLED